MQHDNPEILVTPLEYQFVSPDGDFVEGENRTATVLTGVYFSAVGRV